MDNKLKVYAGWNNSLKNRMKSSSGGIFRAIADFILNNSGIVYGVAEIDNRLIYIKADSPEQLEKMQGSKYYQADTTLIDIEEILKNIDMGLNVMLIGTPCQIGMLKRLIINKQGYIKDNLILADLICHGVGSKKVVDIYRKEMSLKHKSEIKEHKFRYKDETKGSQKSKIFFENENVKVIQNEDDYYMRLFFYDYILRPSCYKCKYSGKNKVSDITIGDFNGSDRVVKEYPDSSKCVSVIITNTDKGENLIKNLSKDNLITLIETDYDLVASQNIPLTKSVAMPKLRKYAYKFIDKIGVVNTSRMFCYKAYIKRFIKGLFGEAGLKKIKKALKRNIIEN